MISKKRSLSLSKLFKDKNNKYFFILNNASCNKTQVVQKSFEQHKDWIKIEFN